MSSHLLQQILDAAGIGGYANVGGSSGEVDFLDIKKEAHEMEPDLVHKDVASSILTETKMKKVLVKRSGTGVGRAAYQETALLMLIDPETAKELVIAPGAEKRKYRKAVTHEKWWGQLEVLKEDGTLVEELIGSYYGKIRGISTYFAVPKDEDVSRAILNLKVMNDRFNLPWGVNTCDPPRVFKTVQQELGPHILEEIAKGDPNNGKVWVVSMDWRHYFHQYKAQEELRKYFGCCYRDKNGKLVMLRWKNVPMGWSWAAYIAQCLGWHIIGYCHDTLVQDEKATSPPMFMRTKDGKGIVFLYYDNVHAYFMSEKAALDFVAQVAKNMDYYHVHLKYAFVDGHEVTWPSHYINNFKADGKTNEWKEEKSYDDIHIELKVDRSKQITPHALGLEYRVVGGFNARIKQSKIDQLKLFSQLVLNDPKSVASPLGRVMYRFLLFTVPPPDGTKMVRILSKAGKYVAVHKANRGWRNPDFYQTLSEAELNDLKVAYAELLKNDWILGDGKAHLRTVHFAASDASEPGWGGVLYGAFDQKEPLPKTWRTTGRATRTIKGFFTKPMGRGPTHKVFVAKWTKRHKLCLISFGHQA